MRILFSSYFVWVLLFSPLAVSQPNIKTASESLFYVDAVSGSDKNSGLSPKKAWMTLKHARSQVFGKATVIVAGGEYPKFVENRAPGKRGQLTFRAAKGAMPVLNGVEIDYPVQSKANLVFDGFLIRSSGAANTVLLRNTQTVSLVNSQVTPERWSLGPKAPVTAVLVDSSKEILIKRVKLQGAMRGVLVRSSEHVSVVNNYIIAKGGTAVQWFNGNSNGVIEKNHITSEPYPLPSQDPLAFVKPHQSAISIRSSGLKIRGNHIHHIGSSAGIMTYTSMGEFAYEDILIENNAIYATFNPYVLRFYNYGRNIVIRNNFLYASPRVDRKGACDGRGNDMRYIYNTAIAVQSVAPGFEGTHIELYNNIVAGITNIVDGVRLVESHNIFWTLFYGGVENQRAPSNTGIILNPKYGGCGRQNRELEHKGIFKSPVHFAHLNSEPLDLSVRSGSIAHKAANPEQQAFWSLGTIGDDGFLKDDCVKRSRTSAGNIGPME